MFFVVLFQEMGIKRSEVSIGLIMALFDNLILSSKELRVMFLPIVMVPFLQMVLFFSEFS